MSIGIGNLLNMFLHNGATNTVKGGVLHRSDPPQAILVESQADLEHLGEVPAGSIAYTAGYSSMWQLSAAGSWEAIQEEGGSGGGGAMLLTPTVTETSVTFGATYAEVKAAMMSGRDVVFIMGGEQAHALYKLVMCEDAIDPTQGDTYTASFYNPETGTPERAYADTEDGELYVNYGG